MPTVSSKKLTEFAESIFRARGVPTNEATIVSRSLVDANLCGHDSHGVIRIPQYLQALSDGRLRPGAEFRVVKETAGVLVVDGSFGLGQVQAHRLVQRLIPRAQALGLAAGTLKNCGHIGRLGEYVETAARERMVLIGTVNGHGFGRNVAPPGGTQGRIGTNPLAMGAPTAGDPVVLDIGTSVCAEGKVRVAFNKKQPVPSGWLQDEHGRPTTDPGVLYRDPPGSILPLGGAQAYKGFGIGVVLEMLAGGLSGAPCSRPDAPNMVCNAVVFILLDINQFAGRAHFFKEAGDLSQFIRTCPRAEGIAEIMLPGDPERKEKARRQQAGIPLDDGTWGQLTKIAASLNVAIPS